ncbi:hypothetical protein EDD86DRAFT_249383 [Gorgonomyces haynaldii]|nr:hypothetical protein EDD86DRAFT_249383 [Gorgonomyces haynaldii]
MRLSSQLRLTLQASVRRLTTLQSGGQPRHFKKLDFGNQKELVLFENERTRPLFRSYYVFGFGHVLFWGGVSIAVYDQLEPKPTMEDVKQILTAETVSVTNGLVQSLLAGYVSVMGILGLCGVHYLAKRRVLKLMLIDGKHLKIQTHRALGSYEFVYPLEQAQLLNPVFTGHGPNQVKYLAVPGSVNQKSEERKNAFIQLKCDKTVYKIDRAGNFQNPVLLDDLLELLNILVISIGVTLIFTILFVIPRMAMHRAKECPRIVEEPLPKYKETESLPDYSEAMSHIVTFD